MKSSSRHLVDPQLLDWLDVFVSSLPAPSITAGNLAQFRALPEPFELDEDPAVRAVKLSLHSVPGPDGAPDVPIRVYQPAQLSNPVGCILHLHGGGFVIGETAGLEPVHRKLVADLGCVLVTVDYRLAPETVFPGNIEDCYAALSWLVSRAAQLKVDRQKIGVMGESAGGGLAAALALLARDRGEFKLAFQHLLYPMLDDRTCVVEDPHPLTGEFLWTRESNCFGWTALLGVPAGSRDVSPYAAPARAGNLTGLPPTFISAATLDLLLEEDIEYARRLTRAGVSVELHVYPGAFHAFDLHLTAKIAHAARRDSQAALTRFLGR